MGFGSDTRQRGGMSPGVGPERSLGRKILAPNPLGLEGLQTCSILAHFADRKQAQREAIGKGCMATYQAGTQRIQPLHCFTVGYYPQHPIHKKHQLAQGWGHRNGRSYGVTGGGGYGNRAYGGGVGLTSKNVALIVVIRCSTHTDQAIQPL